ncbi:hypothetical protein Q8F55_003547 [Vanrija albida]|uniref:Zn(2)-C6 fungal-type domain-containing protein n=1 Tax=Vanrija albida TaxID=181172 RepID=A0ABR3Q4T9_9TREE
MASARHHRTSPPVHLPPDLAGYLPVAGILGHGGPSGIGGLQRTAGPSPTNGLSKPGAKVSCLACRAAKRKCITPDAYTTCKRCLDQNLECEYKKHRRGRRKKVPEGAEPVAVDGHHPLDGSDGGRSGDSKHSRSHSRSPARTSHSHPSNTSVVGQPLSHAQSFIRDNPDSARRTDISFSHVVPIEGDDSQSPYLPGPHSLPLDESILSRGIVVTQQDCPDPVLFGYLTEQEALELFDL